MNEKHTEYALMFKALSDSNRLLIVDYLVDGELCACKILDNLKITQSTLSYHMKTLCESNMVNARKDGKWMHYSLNKEKIKELKEVLEVFAKEKTNHSSACSCK